MGDFEWALVSALNSFFEKDGIAAIAYRSNSHASPANLWTYWWTQKFPSTIWPSNARALMHARQSRSTSSSTSASPPERIRWRVRPISSPARKAGHPGGGDALWRRKSADCAPGSLGQIFQRYNAGETGLSLRDIEINPPLERKGGAYRISRLDIVRISGYFDLADESDGLEEGDPAMEE